jgi:regulator of sigma E protease
MSYLLAFLGIAALVILHEAGHFAAAKAVGMRVEKFSLFFGPMLWSVRRGETVYGVGPIPLGGYVKITGMNPHEQSAEAVRLDEARDHLQRRLMDLEASDTHDPRRAQDLAGEETQLRAEIGELEREVENINDRAYYNQPVWKRVFVILAGPAVNLAIAFGIVWVLFLSHGEVAGPSKQVAAVEKGTPAVGVLHSGDKLVSVDGVTGSANTLRNQLATHRCAGAQINGCVAKTPAKIVVDRNGTLLTFELRPRYSSADRRPLVGFEFGNAVQSVGPVHAASLTVSGLWGVTTRTVSTIAKIFEPQDRKKLNSVVGGYKITQQSFATSTTEALSVLALISLSLGIINLFPFLPLDGGHVFWAVAEKVRGRRIPFEVMERAGVVGFVLILLIFAIGLSNDISTLSGSGFKVPH